MDIQVPTTLRSVAFVLAFIASASCAPPRNGTAAKSQLRYAHTPGWENNTMLAISPGSTFFVCDRGTGATSDIIKAIREWANAAGIDAHLKVQEGCGNKFEVGVEVGPCDAAAVTSHWGVPGQWKITYCGQTWTKSYDITLHEVGHMYGQCDRYGSGGFGHPVRGENCSDQGRGSDGKYNLPSAMQAGGPAHPKRVTEDDRNGVLALMTRSDIRGAQRWRDFLATNNGNISNQNQGTQPPVPNSQQNPNSSDMASPPQGGQGSNSGSNQLPEGSPCANFFDQLIENCKNDVLCISIQRAICGG